MVRPAATSVMMIDDDRVRGTRLGFGPGAETRWHRHDLDYVICAIDERKKTLREPGGEIRAETVPTGTAYRRNCGVEHTAINRARVPTSFVEIEIK